MSQGEDKAAELARFFIFESLSEDELRRVADLAVPRRYDEGQVIFREGDRSDTCFIVRTGRVRITRTHSGGRRLTLAELEAGEMFGELSMFDGEGRSATVEALEDTTTLALLERDVKRVLREHPDIAVKMLARLANRLRAANEKLARQSFQPVAGRVASTLLAQVEARRAQAAAAVDADEGEERRPAGRDRHRGHAVGHRAARRLLAREREPLPRRPRAGRRGDNRARPRGRSRSGGAAPLHILTRPP